MGIRLYEEPELQNPVMIASWPGIGNIGVIAVNSLRAMLGAHEFGEIEPWDYFYPKKVSIRDGELKSLEFPTSKFYYKKAAERDILLFLGEEQPSEAGRVYAEGGKAYQLANLVVDVAQKLNCTRIYTSGAAVAPIHHSNRPRVWAVPNREELIQEIQGYQNTILMSDIQGRSGHGNITGLNGLLLGVARKRNIDAICVMGEIPIYLQGFPVPYPKASKSVLEVLGAALGLQLGLQGVDQLVERSELEIEKLYERFPAEMREQLDKLKYIVESRQAEPGPITEEDKEKILEDIDKLFKRGPKED